MGISLRNNPLKMRFDLAASYLVKITWIAVRDLIENPYVISNFCMVVFKIYLLIPKVK